MITVYPNFIDNSVVDNEVANLDYSRFKLSRFSAFAMSQSSYNPHDKVIFKKIHKLGLGELKSIEILQYKEHALSVAHIDKKAFDGDEDWTGTALLFCSDPEEYVGGELLFPKMNMTIKPPKGTLVVFPAGPDSIPYTHGVAPVISGERIQMVFRFICG